MNYLLDTCVVSDFMKKIPSVIKHLEEISPDKIHISSITVMEIEYGLNLNLERGKKIRPFWESFLKYTHIVPYSPQCAVASASARAVLKSSGLPVGPYDILIAGTSLAHHMTMVTSNMDEFKRIPGIIIENWRNTDIA